MEIHVFFCIDLFYSKASCQGLDSVLMKYILYKKEVIVLIFLAKYGSSDHNANSSSSKPFLLRVKFASYCCYGHPVSAIITFIYFYFFLTCIKKKGICVFYRSNFTAILRIFEQTFRRN